MSLFFGEFASSLAAAGVFMLLLLSAGGLFARFFRFPGYDDASVPERHGIALLCALAVLPILFDFAGRVSPKAIPILAALAIAAGLPQLARSGCPLPKTRRALWLAGGAAWVVVALSFVVDCPDGASGVAHSITALDYVKHSETTWAIAQTGAPPVNPTYYSEEGRAAYYYFFYTLTAAVAALSGWFFGAEPRHAAYAAAAVAGFALLALMNLLWSRARLDEAAGASSEAPRPGLLIAALLLTSGPDILFVLAKGVFTGQWPYIPESWSQRVTSWFDSALWVPHHVCALGVAFIGLLALAGSAPADRRRVFFAGLAFASMAGMSVYVAMAAALTAFFWLCALALSRRYLDALRLVAAGGISAILATPWLLTIVGRVSPDHKTAIAFGIRNADMVDISTGAPALDVVVRLWAMMAIYCANFGIFIVGAYLFWKKAGRKGLQGDAALLLVCGAAASFLLGSFLQSVILDNDLGWRVVLFAQAATLLWTVSAVRAGALDLRSPLMAGLLWLGYASVAYGALQMRVGAWRLWPAEERAVALDEKSAWDWVNANTPEDAVVQARPDHIRAYEFGLYSRRRAAVADIHVGQLFGVQEQAVKTRVAELLPIFDNKALGPEEVDALAARYGVKAIVVNAADPTFGASEAWTQKREPAFSSPRARVYLTKAVRP
ncbi:hypothetical protein [Methylocystis heyeri]|uniref:Uncharacterized protein n=1 Tax=Methylocystis heyeri TaxID=391905 RepID=A0A6B8KIF3_9HYPH|nr:hypothetical protein [Methylocystis heyeri]QGM46313.1 hypothetical protein H2LOC_011740 [Methylocystis heyeri]